MNQPKQTWIHSAPADIALIIAPAFIVSFVVLVLKQTTHNPSVLPTWVWIVCILGVDVAHVYSSLFRTYFNRQERKNYQALLIFVPLICWLLGVLLYSCSSLIYWRVLAYVAVFHFIRQQYGFMSIYSRNEPAAYKKYRWLDAWLIYSCMLYPLAYWHTNLPRNFNWFLEGDFWGQLPGLADEVALLILILLAFAYFCKEAYLSYQNQYFNLPKNLIILGTALSWIVGIVVLNDDFAFTATNVLAHGIPYMALIWLYGYRKCETFKQEQAKVQLVLFSRYGWPLFFLLLWFLAYCEEGLWDGLVWREHTVLFPWFASMPTALKSETLSWLVPLLALPQVTHYVLDAFIWRFKPEPENWSQVLFNPIAEKSLKH